MDAYLKLNLRAVWLITSFLSLTLPIFIPSTTNSSNFPANVIGTATATMFILSFPISIFALPIMFFSQVVIGFDPNTIGGMYVNLWLLFALGIIQWFWLVPRLLWKEQKLQTLDLPVQRNEILLTEAADPAIRFYDRRERTPLERAISDKDLD